MTVRQERPARRGIGAVFPERRLYLRTDSSTRYVALGPLSQMGLGLVFAALLGWTGYTSTAVLTEAMDGRTARVKIESLRSAYEARLAAMADQQRALEQELNIANQRGDSVTAELSEKQRDALAHANRLAEAEVELAALRTEYDRMVEERRAERADQTALNDEVIRLKLALADAQAAEDGLATTLGTFTGAIDKVIAARDAASHTAAALDTKVASLETQISHWEGRQQQLLSQLEDAARVSLDGLDKVLKSSDIDLDSILKQAQQDYSGAGGPFEPIPEGVEWTEDKSDLRLAALMSDLEQVNLMRFATQRLPLGRPVIGGRLTSNFGVRSDPVRGRRAMHAGIDIAGDYGMPIEVTAEGVVTFVGRQSGYGNMIKIRHAFGFETVYAHLSRTLVSEGQRVKRGDVIANMGSTGRSTGVHLHYEVRIDQQPVNPIKFIEAARDVL